MFALRDPIRDTMTAAAIRERRRAAGWRCWSRRPRSISRPRRCGGRCSRRWRWRSGWRRCCCVLRKRTRHERREGEPVRGAAGRSDPAARRVRAGRLLCAAARAAARALRSRHARRPWLRSCACRDGRTSVRWSSAWRSCSPSSSCRRTSGPALVLSCVVLALYAIARGRAAFVFAGFAHAARRLRRRLLDRPSGDRRQRVAIWLDPWNNGVPGGNQIAHGLWALSTGGSGAAGPGLGSPAVGPGRAHRLRAGRDRRGARVCRRAGRRRAVRASELALPARRPRARRAITRAFLATGVALALVVQAFVIAGGLLGLVPLSGVVTPFLSLRPLVDARQLRWRSGSCWASRGGAGRSGTHLAAPIRVLGAVLAGLTLAVRRRAQRGCRSCEPTTFADRLRA